MTRKAKQERQEREQVQRRRPTQAELDRARRIGADPRHYDDIV